MDRTELRRLAGKLQVPLGILEKDQAITVALGVLAGLPSAEELVFKGGTCLRFAYFEGYRFSQDLDFTARADVSRSIADAEDRFVAEGERVGVPITAVTYLREGRASRTLRIVFHDFGGHRNSILCQLSHREQVALQTPKRRIHDPYGILGSPREIPTMDLREILAEKVRAIYTRTQARDMYDVGQLVSRGVEPDPSLLDAKLQWADPGLRFDRDTFEARARLVRETWERDLAPLLGSVPRFDDVIRDVLGAFG